MTTRPDEKALPRATAAAKSPPRKRGSNARPMGRPTRERDPELRHPGVWVIAPQPSARRPHWRLRWCVDPTATPKRFEHEALPHARRRSDAVLRAAAKSRELLDRPAHRPHKRTLLDVTEAFIAAGKVKIGKSGMSTYSPHSRRAIRDGVQLLDEYAQSIGARWELHKEQRSAIVDELRRVIGGRTVLARWVEQQRTRRKRDGSEYAPGTFELAKKWPHAVLARLVHPDGTPVFDALFLAATLPVRQSKARKPARAAEDLAAMLDGAMTLDTADRVVSGDLALVLLSCLRRFEATYLRVRHVQCDAPVRRHAGRLGTWIALPSQLDHMPAINHAKNGQHRSIGFAHRDARDKPLVGLSPLGAELVQALALGRGPDEWLIGSSYQGLATGLAAACAAAKLEPLSPHRLRTTGANHVLEMIGKDRAVQRNGHTEKVFDASYQDDEYELDLWERPASLEASLGCEAQLQLIIARVRESKRSWGRTARPLPHSSERYE